MIAANCLGVPIGVLFVCARSQTARYTCRQSTSVPARMSSSSRRTASQMNEHHRWRMLIMIDALPEAGVRASPSPRSVRTTGTRARTANPPGAEPITAKLVADILTAAGATRRNGIDLHSGQIARSSSFPRRSPDGGPCSSTILNATDGHRHRPAGCRTVSRRAFSASSFRRDLAFVHKRRPTSLQPQHRRSPGGDRVSRGQAVRRDRRHDRHRRNDLRRD